MTSLARSPQEALILGMLAAGLLGLLAAGLLRWLQAGSAWTDLLTPAFFLFAYWLVYNKVPSFPPVGAVNKVFYVAAIGTAIGFLVDLIGHPAPVRALLFLQPIGSAAYVGGSRLTVAPFEVVAAALCGVLVLNLLSRKTEEQPGEPDVQRAVALGVACVGFAPIALLGASSSSFQLSMFVAAAIFGTLVWHLANPHFGFASASLLGGMGGMIAVAQTVVLITRKADLTALAVLGLMFVVPRLAGAVLDRIGARNSIVRIAVFAGMCLTPALISLAIVVARYGSSFPV